MSDSLRPHGLHSPWDSPGQNTGVGSLSLLQGIFPTQILNLGLPHCRQILYQLSHKGSQSTHIMATACPVTWTRENKWTVTVKWCTREEKADSPATGSAQLKQWRCVPDRVVSASLGPLHDWHPLVVIAKERQVKVRAATVGLGTDGELAQQPANGLRVSSVLGVDDSVFKPEIKHQGGRLC